MTPPPKIHMKHRWDGMESYATLCMLLFKRMGTNITENWEEVTCMKCQRRKAALR